MDCNPHLSTDFKYDNISCLVALKDIPKLERTNNNSLNVVILEKEQAVQISGHFKYITIAS